ncbi:pyridoxal phosphate-dependent aminotransferase [Aminivibrio sp.]|jgi:aspartate aminotransferase|uniref:pyridoxal phosphate-dependent aminotransferase n=1 Tax=Aminivibrio sp. TaxID=1872489 RepID=UPI002A1E71E3|nr:pyridoxal phosphate-dependent aminotransferase [Synergistaceae bacterium]MDD3389873.1 pyridoxal phosphate-dependent aminotransferase [Synergistaceae bacterium]MDD4020477.1 pyridoxal phosphate-dependent aminotransferase [Synergistaceae bacterium]MDD4611645.1 pyridoxal phosphate-dependent aminotransferase [Synergistaceae bacterium]
MYISERARKMEPSATLAVTAKAKSLKREGKPVISFGAGEPDFDSPPSAIRYAEEAMRKGQTHYTPGTGIPELRESICTYYKDHFGLEYTPANVVVGAGAKPLLFEALGCLVDPGDEVLVFTPAWVSYVEQIRLLGGKAVLVDTSKTDFIPRFDDVKKAITPRTRAMIVNNPNNPTGAVYDEQCLKDLGRLAVEHNIAILYDEIYERLVYGNSVHHQILNLVPEARDLTVIINGVSKAFAMTGWRIGYALGPSSIMGYLGDFQGHLTSNACSVAQWASVGALKEAEQDVQKMHGAFEKRRDLIVELMKDIPYISFTEPNGAFYVWFSVEKVLGKSWNGQVITDDITLCKVLLESKYVALVPGSAFMADGNVRISYSNSEEEIREGMKRFKEFLEELK